MPPASTRGSLLTRSAVSAVPWCWSATTVPRRTCALTVRPAQLLLSSYEPLSLCTKPSDTSQQCCKTFIATSSSVTCCGQPHFRSPSASEMILKVPNLGQGRSIPSTLQTVLLFTHSWLFLVQLLEQVSECGSLLRCMGLFQ